MCRRSYIKKLRWETGAIPFCVTKIERYSAFFVSPVRGSILQDMGRGVQRQSVTWFFLVHVRIR